MMYPEMALALANDRHRELTAEADRGRLLTLARRARRRRAERDRPTTILASCEPIVAVPHR
ncbi:MULTISPECIES: hypothetical protein [Actinoplanes]|uniref:hypothetical protein n=1 Tax=Actinoplanes TaxID=1865 RepID=UPI0005F2C481|nr:MULTISPECIES: hypothetical protein [Actinoplanes]GLY06531.1 hypothetical protein Acsp01_69100 [Actinoplanes sp. NBRC 101535]